MKMRSAGILFIFVTSVFAMPQIVSGQDAGLAGDWRAANPRTRGITRILVSGAETGSSVRAFGKCHPNDCDWGLATLYPVGDSVEDHSFNRGFAVWDSGFATKFVTITKLGDCLAVETVTIFKDRSGRANFRMREVLKRAGPLE